LLDEKKALKEINKIYKFLNISEIKEIPPKLINEKYSHNITFDMQKLSIFEKK